MAGLSLGAGLDTSRDPRSDGGFDAADNWLVEHAEAGERARRVSAAVAHLPARQRAAIALFYGDGATMMEIAEVLETTPKAIEGLLARARAELAGRLRPLAHLRAEHRPRRRVRR